MKFNENWKNQEIVKSITLGELCVSRAYSGAMDDNYLWWLAHEDVRENLSIVASSLEILKSRLPQDNQIKITSCIRCPKCNEAVGGAKKSLHVQGLAVDMVAPHIGDIWYLLTEEYPYLFEYVYWYRQRKFIHAAIHIGLPPLPDMRQFIIKA